MQKPNYNFALARESNILLLSLLGPKALIIRLKSGLTFVFSGTTLTNPIPHATIKIRELTTTQREGTTMEDKRCPVFVDGKECGLPVTLVDREAGKIARYDLGTYQCTLGHRSYFLLEETEKM